MHDGSCSEGSKKKRMRVTFWNSLEQCEEQVRELLDEEGENPFLNFDWLRQHWEHFGSRQHKQMLLAGVWRGDRLVTFAPLWHRHRLAGLKEIGLVGEGLSDYLGFAGDASTDALEAVIDAVAERWPSALFRFHDISEDSDLRKALDSSAVFAVRKRVELYPCLRRDLNASGGSPQSSSWKKHRKQIRSSVRRLEKLGDLRFDTVDFDADRETAHQTLSKLMVIHSMRHAGTLNAWCQKQNRAFLEDYLRQAKRTNLLAFVTLLDEMPVGFLLGFRRRERFVAWIQAFHPALAAFGVGHVNLHVAQERCAETGIRVFDLSKGTGHAKRVWADQSSPNYRYYLARQTSLRNWLVMTSELLALRAKVWGRERGWNHYARLHLGEATRAIASWWRQQPGSLPGAAKHDTEWRPLRYRDVADLPMDALTRVLDHAYSYSTEAAVSCRRLPCEVILRAENSLEEFRVALPEQPGVTPALSAVTPGAE